MGWFRSNLRYGGFWVFVVSVVALAALLGYAWLVPLSRR